MTTPIKTQCPHCQTCFQIQQAQLNKDNATVRCDQCQRLFLVSKNLVVNSDNAIVPPTEADTIAAHKNNKLTSSNDSAQIFENNKKNQEGLSNAKSSLNKRNPRTPSPNILIHDDMDAYEPEDTSLEYDSLDSMDAWLDKINNGASVSANEPSNTSSYEQTNKSTSSSVSNDINANIDDTTDNLWLEKLLNDQNKNEEIQQDDTDLSRLLLDMGVPLTDEDNTSDERVRRAQDRFIPTPKKRSAASVLWILGCLVLALLLFAQYAIFNLETLVKNPTHAKRLQAICAAAACSLPSADINALSITNANHKSSQIKINGAFSDVSATLNNQSANAQLYPDVKVSVYGSDNLIGEFIAAPEDYLLSKQSQLAADSSRRLLFTIPVSNAKIREVSISPLY